MRDIKFRAWHKDFGEMVYTKGDGIFEKREFSPFVFEVGFSHYPESGWEIMQFTGLKDKNGKEIYEGDILRRLGWRDIWENSYEDKVGISPINITTEVVELKVCSDEFGNTSFGYSLKTQRTYTERTQPATYEVIGNICENHELLNDNQ